MKIVALVTLGFVLTACVANRGARASMQGASALPPGCSPMHGGVPETPSGVPLWRFGAPLSPASGDSTFVVVRVVRALDSLPLSDARVVFGAAPNVVGAPPTDVGGYTVVHLHEGRTPVLALRIGHKRFTDTVTVRAGFRDTLWLRLGTDKVCFT